MSVKQTANTKLIDNHTELLKMINKNVSRGAKAVGLEAVGMVNQKMQRGYNDKHGKDGHTAIRDTGDLMRDVNYAVVQEDGQTIVRVGNNLKYALFVHEGTYKLKGRPYLKDAINEGWNRLKQIWKEYTKEGVK